MNCITEKEYKNLIYSNDSVPLSSVAYHSDVDCIKRFFPDGFPVHLAVHHIDDADTKQRRYTKLHSHDVDEINILVGDDPDLIYSVQFDTVEYTVKANTSIWIPAGLPHAANVIRGSGYYIAIRMNNALKIPDEKDFMGAEL